MKKLFLFPILFGFAALFAEEPPSPRKLVERSFFYADVGGILPFVPNLGVGYRWQKDHLGMDVSLDFATIIQMSLVKITPSLFYYFSRELSSSWYLGGGVDIGITLAPHKSLLWDRRAKYIAPSLIFGKQFENKKGKPRFFQASLSIPEFPFSHQERGRPLYFPCIYLKYGFAF